MFCIYLQVLVPGQRHGSCVPFGDLRSKDGPVVSYDGLDARLIMHVHDEFFIQHLVATASALASCPSWHLKKSCIQTRCIHSLFQEYPMNAMY